MPYIYFPEEPASVSPKEHATEMPEITARYPRPNSPIKKLRPAKEIGSRAAGQHKFIVANMFGPVDWDYDMLSEEEVEPQVESKGRETTAEVVIVQNAKSTFERGKPLCEANMFGPLDWALELMDGSAFLEHK